MTIIFKVAEFSSSDFHAVASPLTELMAILHTLAEPDHHLEARAMLNSISDAMDEPFLREFRSLSPLWARYRCRLFFPLTSQPKAFEAELEAIEALPLETFTELFAEGVQGLDRELQPIDLLLSDTPQREAYLKYCLSRSSERYDLAVALLGDPEATRRRLVSFLEESNERFFRREWHVVRDDIYRAVEIHNRQGKMLPSAEAISQLHYSARYLPEAGEIRFDKLQRFTVPLAGRSVVAVPSVRIGSHLTIKWQRDLPVIVHFPLVIANAGPLRIEAMRRRLAAFNSDSRMELFRHLAGEPITTSELSDRMDQNAAQISRELRVLRDADLLISERRGKRVYHRINIDKVVNLGPDLISILLR